MNISLVVQRFTTQAEYEEVCRKMQVFDYFTSFTPLLLFWISPKKSWKGNFVASNSLQLLVA